MVHQVFTDLNSMYLYKDYYGGVPAVNGKSVELRPKSKQVQTQSCCYVHFQTNTFGKDTNPFIYAAIGYHCCSSTRMALNKP